MNTRIGCVAALVDGSMRSYVNGEYLSSTAFNIWRILQ